MPPYLAAYAFGEFFLFTGPVQSLLRALTGWQVPQDYWFPDIRSTAGAAFVLTFVLYPYVYLTSRVVFLMQGRNIADVARTLGASPTRTFLRVLLPVARPAIGAGVILVLMETINDIGVAEYLGVRTLTSAVYVTWINRGSLEGAAQIAMLMLVLVTMLLIAEQFATARAALPQCARHADEGAPATHPAFRPVGRRRGSGRRPARRTWLRRSALRVRPLCGAAAGHR